MSIISQNSNDVYYAYTRGRFWRWDESARVWKESHLLAQKFDKAKAAEKHLTPEAFLTSDEFIPMDDYELPERMLTALREAKPCKNAPIEPVEEESSSNVSASCICSTCTCGGCKEECFGNCRSCGHPVQECNSYQTEGEKHLTPTLSEDVAEPFGNIPADSSFDFSALGELSEQAVAADQQFDLHYGAAQDEYLISCIYLARIHTLTAKAGRYGGGTWTKWYESKGLGEGSVRRMIQNGEAFNSANLAELKQLPELTRKDLNLIARSGCAEQVVAAGGDSQRVQALLAQIKAEKERADAAETREEEARKAAHEYHEKYEEAAAMRATLLDQQGVYIADIDGLKKQNAKLQQSYHDADEGRIAARLQCQKAEAERDRAEERAKDAEEALKHQPITAVIDEEEIDRRAAEKAWGLADARNAELAKDNANLKKQVAALRSRINDDAQADFEQANYCASLMRAAWDNSKASYSRLVGEDLESTFQAICGTLNSIMEEASLLCRQPPDYDGGDRDE